MNPITHALAGWCLAETVSGVGARERAAIVLASVAPDLDGVGLPFELATRNGPRPLLWWSEYHHVLGHNLLSAVIVASAAAIREQEPKTPRCRRRVRRVSSPSAL